MSADAVSVRREGQSRWSRLRRVWLTAILGTAGLLLSGVLYGRQERQERNDIQIQFASEVDRHIGAIQSHISKSISRLHGLARLMERSPVLARRDFQNLTASSLANRSELLALEWVPRVFDLNRAAYQAEARRDGLSDYRIRNVDSAGMLTVAAPEAEYFPVYFSEPEKSHALVMGLNLASDPSRLALMHKARDTGGAIVTDPFMLMQETKPESGVMVLVPVYHSGTATDTVEQRREHIRGFLLCVLRVRDMVELVLPASVREEMRLHLADGETSIYGTDETANSTSVRRTLDIGDRTWTATASASVTFLNTHAVHRARTVLAFGIFLTLSVCAIIFVLIGQTARITLTVAERTRTLDESRKQAMSIASELKYQKFALDHHAIVSITDVRGNITYVNDGFCNLSGYSRDELIGRNHRLIKSDEHTPEFFRDLWKTITAGRVWSGEIKILAKNGNHYWVDSTIVPFKDETGKITQYVAVRTDISDAKFARQRLELANLEIEGRTEELEAQKFELIDLNASLKEAQVKATMSSQAKSEFLANMSHEIRTPMTAILGFADNMLDTDQSESEKLDCVHTIRHNGEYLMSLINDILDLSKIEAGKMTVERRVCDPCRIVAEVVTLMRVRADAKGLPLNIEFIGPIPESILSDSTRLRQILINLIGNAIKFTEIGSVRLVIRFVDDGDAPYLQFDLIDTGRGMTPEQGAKLFQPFTQADNSTTRKFGGTGLGLTISKRFAELLGGDITIVATEFGVGTTFRAIVRTGSLDGVKMLENPKLTTVVVDTPGGIADVQPLDLHGLRILLAEDGPDNQRLISFVLKKAGADVTVVENGKLALEATLAARDEGKPFDVILMDMQMPVMDGYEATGQLRRKGYTAPIVALTAHAMASDREQCINAGCDDYATKPIDRKKLVETIQRQLVPTEAAPPQQPRPSRRTRKIAVSSARLITHHTDRRTACDSADAKRGSTDAAS